MVRAKCARDLIYECAFARAGSAGDADAQRLPRIRKARGEQRLRCRGIVFHERNRPRQRTQIAGAKTLCQRGTSGLESGVQGASVAVNRIAVQGRLRSSRAITMRWISLVPSPIVHSLTSR
jgi:hypothetical protein